jgi:hypothetical protein
MLEGGYVITALTLAQYDATRDDEQTAWEIEGFDSLQDLYHAPTESGGINLPLSYDAFRKAIRCGQAYGRWLEWGVPVGTLAALGQYKSDLMRRDFAITEENALEVLGRAAVTPRDRLQEEVKENKKASDPKPEPAEAAGETAGPTCPNCGYEL